MYVDADGVLRTDHELRLWSASAVRLHYKLERVVTIHSFHLAEVPRRVGVRALLRPPSRRRPGSTTPSACP